MKQALIVAHLLVLIACKTPAQTALSPNNLNGAEATLFLDNGDSLSGKLTLNNEVLLAKDIAVATPQGVQQLHVLDVKGYAANGAYYELKHTENHIHPRSGFYFMRRLTPDGSAMHLYEHIERKQKGKSPTAIVYEPVYYLQLPGEKFDRVYPSFSKALVPHFHKKMSSYVEGCPELATQVHDKTKGFFYSRLDATEAQRKEVLLRIIDAYNNCKQPVAGK